MARYDGTRWGAAVALGAAVMLLGGCGAGKISGAGPDAGVQRDDAGHVIPGRPDGGGTDDPAPSDGGAPEGGPAQWDSGPYVGPDAGPALTSHPRIWLDPPALAKLRQRAAAGDAAWTALEGRCDDYKTQPVSTEGYPDGIGEGYQGDGYLDPVFSLGLCYQVQKEADAAAAAPYAAKAVEVIVTMAGNTGVSPLRDDGYGIRNYGVGMAIGYDWVFDAMSDAQRQQVRTGLARWIDTCGSGGFLADGVGPSSAANYFAGFFAAKGLAALATELESAEGATWWTEWLQHFRAEVQPYYAENLAGGGWPEGWNYGPRSVLHMTYPVLAAFTAKGLDLVDAAGAAPFTFPLDEQLNLIHFTWPSHRTLDDRGALYQGDNPTAASSGLYTSLYGLTRLWSWPSTPAFHSFVRGVRVASDAEPWQDFLFWDEGAPEADFAGLPLSYHATGMHQVAMRSSWATDGVWGSFVAGPYTGSPDSGEEFYDQGSLAVVRADRPLLVNATGYLLRDATDWGEEIYADNYGGGGRTLYNVFYNGEGQRAVTPDEASTRVEGYEDGGGYVACRGVGLEELYPSGAGVTSWTRQIVYLRPQAFVVYDRTVTSGTDDPRMAFHVSATPTRVTATGGTRYDVSGGAFAGAVTALLPASHQVSSVDVFGSGWVYRLEVRPQAPAASLTWLTVVDAAASAGAVARATRLSAADGNVHAGAAQGVLLEGARNQVALFAAGAPGSLAGPVEYSVPAQDSTHVVLDLPPGGYSVAVATSGGHRVTITAGGALTASAAGILAFRVSAAGAVTPGA